MRLTKKIKQEILKVEKEERTILRKLMLTRTFLVTLMIGVLVLSGYYLGKGIGVNYTLGIIGAVILATVYGLVMKVQDSIENQIVSSMFEEQIDI